MITLDADKTVAIDSVDHTNPFGCVRDNNTNKQYIDEVKQKFDNKKINVLDLGCSGGQLIIDHVALGDVAVGLEGSFHVFRGAGAKNWLEYNNKNLFLCDITENFSCKYNNQPLMFDYIQCWEVFEHIPKEKLAKMLQNILKHMHNNSIFCGSICVIPCPSGNHVCLMSKDEWKQVFAENGLEMKEYIFKNLPRSVYPEPHGFVFTATKI